MKVKGMKSIMFTVLGILLIGLGFIMLKLTGEAQGVIHVLPYLSVAIGCGVFGHNFGNILSYNATKNYPEIVKNIEIEQRDERNIALSNKAKAEAYRIMLFVYGAIILTFALMNVELIYTLLLVLSYLFIVFSEVYFRVKYNKEM